ncbi:universal stress protein [Flavobacterium sp. LPB0248]|uniref:universal stress protein n=1 Tax=Flavobacterium sp. LPB0248 TaxID=2614441 RepID=UPI0015A68BA8|nr:universal stress protein [Flavobacterium sp. LPB0248]QLC64753.1 universal stress protein [Flavobacterium sp. LPB0248]
MAFPAPIIAATDFSSKAESAVAYACELVKARDTKLILLNSFSLSIHSLNYRISAAAAQKEFDYTTERLISLGNDLSRRYNIKVESYCLYMSSWEKELSAFIQIHEAELLVMGMAERSPEQDLMGNSTTTVIKKISIPVMAVPEHARFNDVKKILFAFDNLNLSKVKRLDWFISKAKIFKAEVEFFSVDQKDGELKTEPNREDIIDDPDLKVKFVFKSLSSDTVLNEIKNEIKNYDADILVMVPQKHGFWDSLLHISKTRAMASGLDIPLLSLPNY